jgi:hypothetical protein
MRAGSVPIRMQGEDFRSMKALRVTALGLVLTMGCFRQIVDTGRTPASVVIDRPWTSTWMLGLVPAAPIDVTAICRSGIATVVTRVSAPNLLASIATVGIWTPRHVTVTCATGSATGAGGQGFHGGTRAGS